MTGKKRSHESRSNSRSLSPDRTKHSKPSKGSSEQTESSKELKRKRSSSSDGPASARSKKSSKSKKKRSRSRSSSSSNSTLSDTSSSCSSRNSNLSKTKEKKKLKKLEKKKQRKEKKLKKKRKKEKRRLKKTAAAAVTNTGKTKDAKPEVDKSKKPEETTDRLLMDRAKAMAPMTKEEWEKRQSVIRRVFDKETGRHRLVKGDGEVLEEIVSRDRHREINRQATQGDGAFFQSSMAAKLRK